MPYRECLQEPGRHRATPAFLIPAYMVIRISSNTIAVPSSVVKPTA